ncbi:MAG: hypothetical protein C5B48_15475 [Candidatus Rokuibacteriota bacterium]|nr:MAG: hypothetical protein C5B48_15475 [Candidatus Rokubacteria bacterium]
MIDRSWLHDRAMVTTRSRKLVALILSGIFPGLGQVYNRQPIKGAAFLAVGGLLSWLVGRAIPLDVDQLMSAPPGISVVLLSCLLLAIWIWSVIDAWRVAER